MFNMDIVGGFRQQKEGGWGCTAVCEGQEEVESPAWCICTQGTGPGPTTLHKAPGLQNELNYECSESVLA